MLDLSYSRVHDEQTMLHHWSPAGDEFVTKWSNATAKGWRARGSNLVAQNPPFAALDGDKSSRALDQGKFTSTVTSAPGASSCCGPPYATPAHFAQQLARFVGGCCPQASVRPLPQPSLGPHSTGGRWTWATPLLWQGSSSPGVATLQVHRWPGAGALAGWVRQGACAQCACSVGAAVAVQPRMQLNNYVLQASFRP